MQLPAWCGRVEDRWKRKENKEKILRVGGRSIDEQETSMCGGRRVGGRRGKDKYGKN